MINRLPLTVGFARVSQATEDQGNLETQTRQLQDYGVHELVTEVGSGARSDRRALRDLQARLQAGDTLVVTAIDNVGLPATWAWFEHHRCAVDRCGEEPGGVPHCEHFFATTSVPFAQGCCVRSLISGTLSWFHASTKVSVAAFLRPSGPTSVTVQT